MGSQVGMALKSGCPVLSHLPQESCLTPLLFRVVKKGAWPLSDHATQVKSPFVVGEGRDDCYLYLGELKVEKGRHMASFGLDLLSGDRESVAILDGIIEALKTP